METKSIRSTILLLTRIVIIVVAALLASLALAAYLKIKLPRELETITDVLAFKEVPFDLGGLSSLFATVALMLSLRVDKEIIEKVRGTYTNSLWRLIILFLILSGLIGAWLAIRTIGLLAVNYLVRFSENNSTTVSPFNYTLSNIFLIVSFALTANLCFTLMRAFSRIACQEKEDRSRSKEKREVLRELVDIGIQAIIVGLIAFIPRYGDSTLLSTIGGSSDNGVIGFMIILACMLVSLLVLVFVRSRLERPQNRADSIYWV